MDEIGDLKRRLRIKYGLEEYPTDRQIASWLNLTAGAIAKGEDAEAAGREAAETAFIGVDRVMLFSEADTIEALLMAAAKK